MWVIGLVLALGLALVSPVAEAQPRDFALSDFVGGTGGSPWEAKCPPGAFLIGLFGRTGSWIDRLGLICATWDARCRRMGDPQRLKGGGGNGGAPATATCPANTAVAGMRAGFTRGDEMHTYLRYVRLRCRGLHPPHTELQAIPVIFGNINPPSNPPLFGTFKR